MMLISESAEGNVDVSLGVVVTSEGDVRGEEEVGRGAGVEVGADKETEEEEITGMDDTKRDEAKTTTSGPGLTSGTIRCL